MGLGQIASPSRRVHLLIVFVSVAVGFIIASGSLFQSTVSLSYNVLISIPQAAEYQQTISSFVPHTRSGDATIGTLPAALPLEWAYNYSRYHSNGDRIIILTNQTQFTQGSKMIFVVKPLLSSKPGFHVSGVNVFVIDPLGTVEGIYPAGSTLEFNINTAYFTGSGLAGENATAFNQGNLAFSFRIPNDNIAQGPWKILAFGTGVSYQNLYPQSVLVANATSITVLPHESVGFLQSYLSRFAGPFGTASALYGWLMLVARVPAAIGPGWRRRLWNAFPLIMLGVGFLLLGYYIAVK